MNGQAEKWEKRKPPAGKRRVGRRKAQTKRIRQPGRDEWAGGKVGKEKTASLEEACGRAEKWEKRKPPAWKKRVCRRKVQNKAIRQPAGSV